VLAPIVSLSGDAACARGPVSPSVRRWRKLIALNAAFCPTRFDANVFPRPVAARMLAALRQNKYCNACIGEQQQ
jgi:hypothetical protein